MFKKISIRWRLTILSALLLMVCSIGLTVALNFSAFQLADKIEVAEITTPATETDSSQAEGELGQVLIPAMPAEDVIAAKKGFSVQSVIYMLFVIVGGSALTYYISGRVLKPLDALNTQIKNISVNNLSVTLDIPPTKDEIAELTESFNAMTDKLNDAFIMQKRFSADAAHELRTPLTVLQTKVDVFRKKSSHTNDEYEALISVLQKQISRLRSLVKNLLDMTNMDDDSEQRNICLKDLFEDIVSDLSSIAEMKNISLSLCCDNSSIDGNLDLLYRGFYNLVENSIKYNNDGGFVRIDVKNKEAKTIVQITDNGIGIPDEIKKHIFEPFYRVDKSRSREMGGAGLGLSIVDSIIKKHGGSILVFDAENGGTCFEIIL